MDISCNFSYNLMHLLPLRLHISYQHKLGAAAVQIFVFVK